MQVFINDQPRQCKPGTRLDQLLEEAGFTSPHIAVSVDLLIIPRYEWPDTLLHEESRILVIAAFQGG